MKKLFFAVKTTFVLFATLFISFALFSLGIALFSGTGPTASSSASCVENTCESCPAANDCVEPANVIVSETRQGAALLNPAESRADVKSSCADCQLFYACGNEANIDMSDLCLDADPFKLTGDTLAGAGESFDSLKASVSEAEGYSVRIKGDAAVLEKLSKQLSSVLDLKENKNSFCEIVMTGPEMVVKLNETAKPEKKEFPF